MQSVLTFLLVILLAQTVKADPGLGSNPIPTHAWTPEARIWLARALVGESGWDNRSDMASVAWVLAKRWQFSRPDIFHFENMVKAYACPVKWRTPRPWVRQLPADGSRKPRQWPGSLGSWGSYTTRWQAVLEFADSWARGDVQDPTPTANHYGSKTDPRPRGCPNVSTKRGVNVFYACGSMPQPH